MDELEQALAKWRLAEANIRVWGELYVPSNHTALVRAREDAVNAFREAVQLADQILQGGSE